MTTTRPISIDPTAPDLARREGPPALTTRPTPDLTHPHQQPIQNAAADVLTSYRYALGPAASTEADAPLEPSLSEAS